MVKEKLKKNGLVCFLLVLIVVLLLIIGGGIYYFVVDNEEVVDNVEESVIIQQGNNCTTNIYMNKKDVPTYKDIEYDTIIGDVSYHLSYSMSENDIDLNNTFIKSKEELNEYFEKFFELDEDYLSLGGIESGWISLIDVIKKFDDEYFEKHNLAINVGPYNFISVNIQNGNETINFRKLYTQGTLALPKYFNFITLNKDVEKVNFDIYTYRPYKKESIIDVLGDYFEIIAIIIGIICIIIFLTILYKSKNKVIKTCMIILLVVVILGEFLCVILPSTMSHTNIAKPIIYLYPQKEQEVSVKLGNPENLTCTYPKYKEDGWNVIAKPNGDLINLEDNRNLYALFWEGKNIVKPNMSEGFVVKGENTIEFLEEKLELLGLNEREAEEFIVYWLPQMENNKYNFIRFQTMEEIDDNMPLEITPKPDTVIRVVMEWKPLDKYIDIPEQILNTPVRNGFTVVEWGGTEIK